MATAAAAAHDTEKAIPQPKPLHSRLGERPTYVHGGHRGHHTANTYYRNTQRQRAIGADSAAQTVQLRPQPDELPAEEQFNFEPNNLITFVDE